jgi:hypothetical protein
MFVQYPIEVSQHFRKDLISKKQFAMNTNSVEADDYFARFLVWAWSTNDNPAFQTRWLTNAL